jgi:ligand-binding sensor domain-containing protein
MFCQTDYSNQWEDLYAYTNVKDVIKSGNTLYALTDNAVFLYDIIQKTSRKISSIHGLSGEITSAIHYSENFQKLIIGYKNGLIEVIDEDGKITSSPEIINFNQTGEKQINDIYEYNNKLYLATPFAMVVYDINRLEFGDTYFIGIQSSDEYINQITVLEDTIYAATKNGVYIADINNPNLIDFNQWTRLFEGDFSTITMFNNKLFTSKNNQLFRIDNTSLTLIRSFNEEIQGIKSSSNSMSIALDTFAVFLNENLIQIAIVQQNNSFPFALTEALEDTGDIYLATSTFGILKTNVNTINTLEEIHPKGPLSNAVFSIKAHNNSLWVVYGGYDDSYTPLLKRDGFSHFNSIDWINRPFDNTYLLGDLTSITIDENKENSVYISSYGDITGTLTNSSLTGGIFHVEENEITTFYNHQNSPLEDIVANIPNRVTIRIGGTTLDREGNLWVTNIGASKRLKKLSPNGQWTSFDIQSIVTSNDKLGMNEIEIDQANTIWIGTRRNGVYAFNENGNRKKALTTEVTKGSLPNLNVRTVAIDKENRIWLGTLTGLVVFTDAFRVFENDINDASPIIITENGIPRRLLGDQTVNSIVVDGANNKWFGTETGGVLYTNSNGEETLAKFDKNNSPLPSNKIIKISVDKTTGKVYFATNRGIVAYNSNVASFGEKLGEVYSYPNPALKNHPTITIDGRNGTHLPKGTNVKILDVSGNLVYETNVVEEQELNGGKVIWNKHNLAGNKVASGIYIVLLSNKNNTQTSTTKIAIVN